MIYLNNAATSWPKPPIFTKTFEKIINAPPSHSDRSTFNVMSDDDDGLTSEFDPQKGMRDYLAKICEISDPSRIVYTFNATNSLNIAILGYDFKPGDMVITTKAEHNSVLRPLYYLKKKGIIDYVEIDTEKDGRLDMQKYSDALKKYNPRMVVFSHASNVTGAVNPAAWIAELAKKNGAVVLMDASQSAGIIPVLPEKWNVDMAAFTGHKYLLGPQGTGALYVSEEIDLNPVYTGGTGVFSDMDEMPETYPSRLQAGTQNETGMELLSNMIRWSIQNPADTPKILERLSRLENTLKSLGCNVITVDGERTPVLSFISDKYQPEDIGDMLFSSYDIICRTGLHCAPHIIGCIGASNLGTVRISISRFTSDDEIEEVESAFRDIFGSRA